MAARIGQPAPPRAGARSPYECSVRQSSQNVSLMRCEGPPVRDPWPGGTRAPALTPARRPITNGHGTTSGHLITSAGRGPGRASFYVSRRWHDVPGRKGFDSWSQAVSPPTRWATGRRWSAACGRPLAPGPSRRSAASVSCSSGSSEIGSNRDAPLPNKPTGRVTPPAIR